VRLHGVVPAVTMRRRTKIVGGLIVVGALGGAGMLVQTLRHGFSAQDEPTRVEHVLARAMRHYAVPSDLRDRRNPVPLTPEVLAKARAHFADHCASCHGNDGKGKTAMGPNFYPKVPDMTLPKTQSLSDGEIFATIENGIRLTGMPAWGNGTAESAYGSWTLVHFIRHLPKITAEEVSEMEELNPKTREELEEEEAIRKYLAGEGEEPPTGSGGHETKERSH
jgi:mono/diheme cytochrome c family protein